MNPRTCPMPGCCRPTVPQRDHPSLYLPCTEADIGETLAELRTRVSAGRPSKGNRNGWRR